MNVVHCLRRTKEKMPSTIALVGATGAIGNSIANTLRQDGTPYRAIGRNRQTLEAEFGTDPLAEIVVWNPDDPASVRAAMKGIAEILERSRENGPMRDAPLAFVLALANALADATIDYIISDPDHADTHSRAGFDALWRMIA